MGYATFLNIMEKKFPLSGVHNDKRKLYYVWEWILYESMMKKRFEEGKASSKARAMRTQL